VLLIVAVPEVGTVLSLLQPYRPVRIIIEMNRILFITKCKDNRNS
jgi:hypothetical protein